MRDERCRAGAREVPPHLCSTVMPGHLLSSLTVATMGAIAGSPREQTMADDRGRCLPRQQAARPARAVANRTVSGCSRILSPSMPQKRMER